LSEFGEETVDGGERRGGRGCRGASLSQRRRVPRQILTSELRSAVPRKFAAAVEFDGERRRDELRRYRVQEHWK
jgi:hypothetical protein